MRGRQVFVPYTIVNVVGEIDMGAHGSRQFHEQLESLKSNDPRLYSLSLEQVPLGDEGVRVLARALHSNKILRRLCVGHCNISPLGLQWLVSALCDDRSVPPKLRRLELSTSPAPFPLGNPIGDNGATSIAHLLLNCDSLRKLSLGSCNLGDEGAGILAQALTSNTTLRTLDLSYNSISDIGAEKFGAVLAHNNTLRGLSLWHNRVFHSGAEALANGIASNTTLKWLGLGCNHIGDEGVKALALALLSNAHDSQLMWLGLGGNEITDRGAEHLAVALKAQHGSNGHFNNEEGETSSLTEQIRAGGLRPALELGVTPSHVSLAAAQEEEGEWPESEDGETHTDLEDTGPLGDWVYCIPLESVGLGGNQITCTGATALADGLKSNTRLVSLGLADNLISDDGAAALAELVRQSDTLESLVLSGNDIGNEGGSIMIAALTQNTSLKSLYMADNPLGDEVSERCLEVVGHHNHTLQLLDVHNTRMSTPAVSSLVEGMQEEGVLRALGSQPLPVRSSSGIGGSHDLPATGNMLEMQDWKPPSYHTVLLQKQGKRFTSTAPSQRYTTFEALGSLPPLKETAQALVIKEIESEGGGAHKRRESISHFFRRKFSRKKDSSTGSYDISQETPSRRISKLSPHRGHELHTLSENDEEESGGPAMEETMLGSQLEDQPFMVSTLISSERSHSQPEDGLPASSPPPLQDDDYPNPPQPSTHNYASTPKPPNQNTQASDYLDAVESSEHLPSLTKNRARPPTNRRPPSRQRSSSPSPRHRQKSSPSPDHSSVTRIGGITSTTIDSVAAGVNESWPDLDATSIKLQWRATLQKRIGMLNMGSFLHTGFESVNDATPNPIPDVSYACLPRNKAKNRDNAPLPPAHSRVKLQLVLEEVGSDYINANYVSVPGHVQGRMIVTQAPMRNTTGDFWRMVWEQRTSILVVITSADEGIWWPKSQASLQRHSLVIGRSWAEGCLNVKVVSTESKEDFIIYRLSLESLEEQESDTVLLFHFTGWPCHAVPNNGLTSFSAMFQQVIRTKDNQQMESPMMVVSGLGAGRAGCFCSVAIAHQIMSSSGPSFIDGWAYDANILDMVIRGVRSCRGNLVENQRQYEFCHRLLEEVLVGGSVRSSETPSAGTSKGEKKTSKWRLFHGKTSNDQTKNKSNPVSLGKQTKQGKKNKKVSKGASKQSVVPEPAGVDPVDEDAWGDNVTLLW